CSSRISAKNKRYNALILKAATLLAAFVVSGTSQTKISRALRK
ncbi:ribulose-phosphate 3-epimerase, partial [Vibrio parahaemolyticus VPTS-2010_2]